VRCLKMRPMTGQNFPKRHSISACTSRRHVRVRAAYLNRRDCRRVPLEFCKAAMGPRQNSRDRLKRQNSRQRRNQGVLKSGTRLMFVATEIPVHQNHRPTKLIASFRVSACLQHRPQNCRR
jgi:hypothetical protein